MPSSVLMSFRFEFKPIYKKTTMDELIHYWHTYKNKLNGLAKILIYSSKATILAVMKAIFYNCVKKPEKFRTSTGFEPVTLRYRS